VPTCRLAWVALIGAGCAAGSGVDPTDGAADPPEETGLVATPPPGPPLDTGLPAPAAPAPAAIEVEVGGMTICPDTGRDTRFYDRVELGTPPDPHPRNWKGAGLIIDEFDGDAGLEIVAPGITASAFWDFENGVWIDRGETVFAGIDLTDAVGGAAADYDGDGDPDLLVTRFGARDRLLRNTGSGFVDVTDAAGIPDLPYRTASATWADLNGDGWLDVLLGGYGAKPEDAWSPDMPPGDRTLLLLNDGDGTFTDRTDLLPDVLHDAYTFQIGVFDVAGDGFPDIFAVNDFGWIRPSLLLHNHGVLPGGDPDLELDDGTAGFHPSFAGMGLAVTDLNHDQLPDFAQSSYEAVSVLESIPSGFATHGVLWAEFSDALGIAIDTEQRNQIFGWGTAFGDLDNDGLVDLTMGFGKWDEYTNAEWQFDEVWVNVDGSYVPRANTNRFRADDRDSTRAVFLADLDADGWLDIAKRPLDAPVVLHRSRCSPNRHWAKLALAQPASPNRRSIGARVTLTAGGLVQTRWVTGGGTSMFGSAPPSVHFGLGDETLIDRIEVAWPDGVTEVVDGPWPVDRVLRLTRTNP
jgi:hypothetical protein